MSVPVTREPFVPGAERETCISCGWPTPYWVGDGHAPLCVICADGTRWWGLDGMCKRAGYPMLPIEVFPLARGLEVAKRRARAQAQEARP